MNRKKYIFLIIALLYILYTVFPLFADIIAIPVWLPSIATVAILLVLYPQAILNTSFYWFLGYAFVLMLYLLVGRRITVGIGSVADSQKIIIEYAYILPSIIIVCILLYLKDFELADKLVKWSVIILYVSFLVAVPLMVQFNSLREALTEQDEGLTVPGLPGYTLMHAYTMFLPVVLYVTKVIEGRKKLLAIILLTVLCFVIYDTFVTTSLVLMILCIIFTCFYTNKDNTLLFISFGGVAIMLFILYKAGYFISLIDWMLPTFEGTAVEPKLNDIRDSMTQGKITGGSITGRLNLHDISKQGFYNNPIIGSSVMGGHSSILDRLGGMGLVGALPYIMMFVSVFRQAYKLYITKMARAFFLLGVMVGVVFLYNKGLFGSQGWLMYTVLMPFGIWVFERYSLKIKKI